MASADGMFTVWMAQLHQKLALALCADDLAQYTSRKLTVDDLERVGARNRA